MTLGKHNIVKLCHQLPPGDQLVQFLAYFVPLLTLQLQCLVHLILTFVFADLLFALFWLKGYQIGYQPTCWIWLLVALGLVVLLPNSAINFVRSSWWLCLIYLQVFVGFWSFLLLDWIPDVLDFCWSFVCLSSGCVDGTNYHLVWLVEFWSCLDTGSVWFGFAWFNLVYFATFLCPSCVDLFSWLGVQGGHFFEPIYWLFAVGLVCTAPYLPPDNGLLQLLSTQTPVKGSASWLPLWSKVWAIKWSKGFVLACSPQPWVPMHTQPRNQFPHLVGWVWQTYSK